MQLQELSTSELETLRDQLFLTYDLNTKNAKEATSIVKMDAYRFKANIAYSQACEITNMLMDNEAVIS